MKIVKYKDFQYRLLMNAIHANNRLFYWKIVNTKSCDYCDKKQTEHLFWECEKIQVLWRRLANYIRECMHIAQNEIEFNCKNVFLNKIHENNVHIVNFITLVVKQYMLKSAWAKRQILSEL